MIAFFTGHRQTQFLLYSQGIEQLINLALKQGVHTFFSGMALGTDQLAAHICCRRSLPWWAIIPCPEQSNRWSSQQRDRYERLLSFSEKRIAIAKEYHPGVMQQRDRWMVENSQLCLAIYDDRPSGGTALTVQMAINREIPVIQFNPITQQITRPKLQHKQLSLFCF